MNRLTKSITLVLISSSLALHGCARKDEEEERQAGGQGSAARGTQFGGSHFRARSLTGGDSSSASHHSRIGSTRGGFGHLGHGAVS